MLLIQNSPRQFSPSEGHGLITVLQIYTSPHRAARPSSRSRGASASDDSDRERASLAARSARGATASAPLHPSPHEDPVPRVSDDAAAMLSVSPVTAALFRPRADDPPFPRGAPSLFRPQPQHRLSCAWASRCSSARRESHCTFSAAWYAAAARRRRCRSGCQQLTAVKSCLLLLLRSIILDLLHYSCKSKLWAKTANHDHWRCRMLVSQAKIELQLSNMIQAQQSKKIIKLYSFRSKL